MSVFGRNYSRYYDLLYKDKDYKGEVDYVNGLIKKYSKKENKTLLDIGCGTGKHLSFFKDSGYRVSGVDLSESMILEAKKNLSQNDNLYCNEASKFDLGQKYDVIVSLFHVMSYQTENSEFEKVFRNVNKHLNDGGLFIFDFWYGPAVLTDPPVVKIKRFEDDKIHITRIAEPVLNANRNVVDVNFEVLIKEKKTSASEIVKETHHMRYLFIPEIEYYVKIAGLKMVDAVEWMKYSKLGFDTWYGLVVVEK
jgi:SAM-dependent methyltransferase